MTVTVTETVSITFGGPFNPYPGTGSNGGNGHGNPPAPIGGPFNGVNLLQGSFQQRGITVIDFANTGDGTGASMRIGAQAGLNINPSDHGTMAIGYQALMVNNISSGISENTAVGWGSQRSSTTGTFNTSLGLNTMGLMVSGSANVAVGTDSMRNSEGDNNVSVGVNTMYDGTHNQNTALGWSALSARGATGATPTANVAIGYQAMSATNITTCANTVAIGANAGGSLTSGSNDVFVGAGAGLKTTSGSGNVGIGQSVMTFNTTGFNQTAVGSSALNNATTGNNNVAIGSSAGHNITIGFSNVIIGPSVGNTTLTTGSSNIFIGASTAIDAATSGENNTFRLGNHATNLIRATGINTATPAFFLDWFPASTSYANDAAAATGGVAVGQIYRNGSAMQIRIT